MNSKGQHILCATHMLYRPIIVQDEDLHNTVQ